MNIPFRNDEYGKIFYYEDDNGFNLIPYAVGKSECDGIEFTVKEFEEDNVLRIDISVKSNRDIPLKRLGMRLGIDSYMDSFPDWNDKFFPTALRCEKNGFWSCFMSPLRRIISVCSPSQIVSWNNDYNDASYDIVGHRIYTSSIDFINTYPQPLRHPKSPEYLSEKPLEFTVYYACPETETAMYDFIEKHSGIRVPVLNKYTLEKGEPLLLDGKIFDGDLFDGINKINAEGMAEVSVYLRKDWFYYLDCARKSAEKCQQKPGTHAESWYGYFSRVLYAKEISDKEYTASLCNEFDKFFCVLTERVEGVCKMREGTHPNRLQNTSAMLSLLADFYELTNDKKYLNDANDLAAFLMTLQHDDGSYRNHGTHYTCVIYPAKSMLELAIAEKEAGFNDRYTIHYESAYKAIKNLELLLDDIDTEGEMTFEDGMISCESLQLGYLAMILPEGEEKQKLTEAAEYVLKKHRCLEQQFLPDCRVRGCTSRFWEARYDINFFANMLNSPHGWTSWKTYATYYLYMLTGKLSYLKDTMDTVGACMQCVDEKGVLNWSFVLDPWIKGLNLSKESRIGEIKTKEDIVGEEYLPMISDWWKHDENALILQYLHPWNKPENWNEQYGGSCDNDVHEHFKCLMETVFGKAFIHETENGFETYNCFVDESGFSCHDSYLKEWIVYALQNEEVILNGVSYAVEKGINIISL